MKYPGKLSIVVLISGYGSNLQAIIDAIAHQKLAANIKAVVSDKADAYGLERAKVAQIPTEVIAPQAFLNRTAFEAALLACLQSYQPELIVLSGFIRILGKKIIRCFPRKIINIHPSLLPKYKGLNTYEQVLKAGDAKQGCSVHFVTEDLDSGPIIAQKSFKTLKTDTVETLKQRTKNLEHQLYPQVIAWFAKGALA